MADELKWAGGRKKSAGDSMGMVTGVRVGVGAGPSALAGDSGARAPAGLGFGKVEGAAITAEQIRPKDGTEAVRPNGRARVSRH